MVIASLKKYTSKVFTGDLQPLRPSWLLINNRYEYQKRYIPFESLIKSGDKVLDIGSGSQPFPLATALLELHPEDTPHRAGKVEADKRLVVGDVQDMPFKDKEFDFIYCAHVLEHVDNPLQACQEIMRVGKRGYIETPTYIKDALWGSAKNIHKWHITAFKDTICFFEYAPWQREGCKSKAWNDCILDKYYHPLQLMYYHSQHIFNVMFLWENKFHVHIYSNEGIRFI